MKAAIQVRALNDLYFAIIGNLHNGIDDIYRFMLKSGIEKKTKGFWIWSIKDNIEIYSPKLRKVLEFKDENDFPNNPKSWQKQIEPEDLQKAFEAYENHIIKKEPYFINVTYNTKHGHKVNVVCYGKVIHWKDGEPELMVGIHLAENGLWSN